ncbi:uncharacterized protein LOC141915137 [Tubulanus polymorphus]|uniref:uncharacterized protein LOC141915137 n=1 Tax=Tubulanus polymorphus TaxID=672921 RepID=UPI003DA5A1E0
MPNQVDIGSDEIPATYIEDTSLADRKIIPSSTSDFAISNLREGNEATPPVLRRLVRNRSAGSERPKPESAEMKDKSQIGSCPNLSVNRHRADENSSSLLSTHRLTVPDFFVTSKTRSRPPRPNAISASSPNINGLNRKQKFRQNSTLSLNEESHSKFYRNACVTQILDFIFIGNITSAFSQHLLCKLNIDRMVDITNKRPEEVPSRLKSICPCSCGSDLPHSRAKLHIGIDDNSLEPIEQYFEEINCFIEATRQCNKRVLIYSYEGHSRAPTIVIQYLMGYYGMTLYHAYTWVRQHHPNVELNPGFQKVLENLERRWYPDRKPSFLFKNLTDNGLRRTAWTDC